MAWFSYRLEMDWLDELTKQRLPLEKCEDFLELSVRQLVIQSKVMQVGPSTTQFHSKSNNKSKSVSIRVFQVISS